MVPSVHFAVSPGGGVVPVAAAAPKPTTSAAMRAAQALGRAVRITLAHSTSYHRHAPLHFSPLAVLVLRCAPGASGAHPLLK